jgi:uncharacterized protein (DUF4213/DUF364 family)
MILENMKTAFRLIRSRYAELQLQAGRLENVGFSGLWTIVRGTREQSGLAFAFNREHAVYGAVDIQPLLSLRTFVGKSMFDLAEHLLDEDALILNSALVATMNALTRPLVLGERLNANYGPCVYRPRGGDWLDFIRPDDMVTMVGFGPVGDILRHVKSCCVCDLRPESALRTISVGKRTEYGPKGVRLCGASETKDVLGSSSVVLITGCTLVNGTLEDLIAWSAGARVVGLYGWSAGILPEFLSGLGINYISANQILRVPEFYRAAVDGLKSDWMADNSFSYCMKM